MRIERWYWLIAFCVISLMIHVGLAFKAQPFYRTPPPPKQAEIEVALEPLPEPKPAPQPEKKLAPKPTPKPEAKKERKTAPSARPAARPQPTRVAPRQKETIQLAKNDKPVIEPRPVAPKAETGGYEKLKNEKPLPIGLPIGHKDAGPKITRIAKNSLPGGGGSPAPGPIPGGHGGAPGPEAPPEDILYNGGGAGGTKLPKEAPSIGGGGGRSILSVENPLAKEAIPEERPGLGPGRGGGQGMGKGGGVGYGGGKGIGTRLDGKSPLASLHTKPGKGIGAGEGSNIGTRPPGGGHGTGAELPGTGGTGIGYGRGKGIGVGNGSGAGVGDGDGVPVAMTRGIPFGDITGLLRGGDPNGGGGNGGGPGGPGRGAVFSARPTGGGGPVHFVYVLDVSGSMHDGNKIGKAKAELKKALSELKPEDTFSIIFFARYPFRPLGPIMLPAKPDIIQEAMASVDNVQLHDGTNVADAMEMALKMPGVSHVFLMSDGEPNVRITDFDLLREYIKTLNTQKVHILTLALGLGEDFKGIKLLKGIADDNDGTFNYVNMNLINGPRRYRYNPGGF